MFMLDPAIRLPTSAQLIWRKAADGLAGLA